jgi:hypothetical protein
MMVNGGATVTLAECDFIENFYAISNITSELSWNEEASNAQSQDTIVRLQRCTFSGNSYDIELLQNLTSGSIPGGEAFIISDPYDASLEVGHTVQEDDYDFSNSTWYLTGHASTVPADRKGINSTSAWLQGVQKVRFHLASPLPTFSE